MEPSRNSAVRCKVIHIRYPLGAMRSDPFQMLTLDDAAALLSVNRRTVEQMVAAGDLKAFTWQRTRRVYRQELARFLVAHTTRAEPSPAGSREPRPDGSVQTPALEASAFEVATADRDVPDTPVRETPAPEATASEPAVAPRPTESAPALPEEPVETSRSIAVLEDDENIRRLLVLALTFEGYTVRSCTSYEELLEICSTSPADLVISDGWGNSTDMLGADERDSIVELARRCPTIMTTGREWAQRVDPAELGLLAIFRKPFELDDLLAKVRDLEN